VVAIASPSSSTYIHIASQTSLYYSVILCWQSISLLIKTLQHVYGLDVVFTVFARVIIRRYLLQKPLNIAM
jgi:hypothetical protein